MLFVSRFVNEIEPSYDHLTMHFKDINLFSKIPLLNPLFMRLIIEEYKQYLAYGLEEPNEVKDYTETICISINEIEEFMGDYTKRKIRI